MTDKKYEFTGETLEHEGRTLKRIRRLSDGKLGGWIESEDNLSHYGDSWVYDNAKVYGCAEGCGYAKVFGDAEVYGNAQVYKGDDCIKEDLGDPNDPVNKPDHYTPKEGEIECIAYIEQVLGPEKFIGYCHGNVTKYLHRHTYKGKPVEDLEKAQVYLEWMLKAMKGEKVRP